MTLSANLAALARRVVGTAANNLVALDGAAKLPAVDGSLLTNATGVKKRVKSDPFTPSAGGLLTWGHGLGATPTRCWATIICQTAEVGYSVGDEFEVTGTTTGGQSEGYGVLVRADATNVTARIGNTYMSLQMNALTGQGGVTQSLANWKVRLWAEL